MRADLHVHSTASDGTLQPAELVSLALAGSLDVLAIADHDSVDGIAAAIEAASGTRLRIAPAVELSAARDGGDVHILAYFVDVADPILLGLLASMRTTRHERAASMVEALNAAGFSVTLDDVLALSNGGSVGRSHIARALVQSGAASTVQDAFERLLGRDKPFYTPKDSPSPAEVVGAMLARGAVPVLAHPGVSHADDLIPELLDAGLMGIEAYHAEHTTRQRDHYAGIARRAGVLATGGTDYHGPGSPGPALGSVRLPRGTVEAFLAAGAARGRAV